MFVHLVPGLEANADNLISLKINPPWWGFLLLEVDTKIFLSPSRVGVDSDPVTIRLKWGI